MEQEKLKTWLTNIGIPQDRALIITENFQKSFKTATNSLSLDDLESLLSEVFTKYQFK